LNSYLLEHWQQPLHLLPELAAWDEQLRTIIVADLHLGKTASFQDAGIPLPEGADTMTLQRLGRLVDRHSAQHVLVLGDVFHARRPNQEHVLELLRQWHAQRPQVQWIVVPGNHDRRVPWSEWMPWAQVLPEGAAWGAWIAHHHPPEQVPAGPRILRFAGHLHPGIELGPRSMKKLRSKCFWLKNQTLIFPAFGDFTGLEIVQREPGERIWVSVHDKVVELPEVDWTKLLQKTKTFRSRAKKQALVKV
jgi:uncharacterized protein